MGKFISFEGGEGSGKSTQVKLLADAMTSQGLDVLLTREPGGAAGAEEIRKLLVEGEPERWDAVTETLLHFAARRDHMETTVAPALAAGRIVITDRFADSTTAYQSYGRNMSLEQVEALNDTATAGVMPDITFLIDLPVEIGLSRAKAGKNGDRMEQEELSFHQRVRDGFLQIAKQEPQRTRIIDGTESIEIIFEQIQGILIPLLETMPRNES